MRYAIAGLGNPGAQYRRTRHNIGFRIVSHLADKLGVSFREKTLAETAEAAWQGERLLLIKPATFMNRSGQAIRYWLQKTGIPLTRCLVVVDDLHLPFAALRLRAAGGAGGHNGLRSIAAELGSSSYPRLRVGIGDHFAFGTQADFVLSSFLPEEEADIPLLLEAACEHILTFCTTPLDKAGEKETPPKSPEKGL